MTTGARCRTPKEKMSQLSVTQAPDGRMPSAQRTVKDTTKEKLSAPTEYHSLGRSPSHAQLSGFAVNRATGSATRTRGCLEALHPRRRVRRSQMCGALAAVQANETKRNEVKRGVGTGERDERVLRRVLCPTRGPRVARTRADAMDPGVAASGCWTGAWCDHGTRSQSCAGVPPRSLAPGD